MSAENNDPIIFYTGTYRSGPTGKGGGIYGYSFCKDSRKITQLCHHDEPGEAGYLYYAKERQVLYAVDERKTDGRGPVDSPAAVFAFSVTPHSGDLRLINSVNTVGPRPTFLDYHPQQYWLVSANHGDFQHVEKASKNADGQWQTEYCYDDSTLVKYEIASDGSLAGIDDAFVFQGQGKDPNSSPQNGGHAQSSPHAHCAVIDPSGRFVLVADKGTDRIVVFEASPKLQPVFTLQLNQETGPRHIAFMHGTQFAFVTLEFSSELLCVQLNPENGHITTISQHSTLCSAYQGCNEPAEVRVHPTSPLVYVNNRGEDTLVWYTVNPSGSLRSLGALSLAPSLHPGLAARSFTFSEDGKWLFIADRPAHSVKIYQVDTSTGSLEFINQVDIPEPAFVALLEP